MKMDALLQSAVVRSHLRVRLASLRADHWCKVASEAVARTGYIGLKDAPACSTHGDDDDVLFIRPRLKCHVAYG